MTDIIAPSAGRAGPDGTVFDGFVHAEAGRLLDGRNEPLLLRGVGLGNWLLPEGYMWNFKPATLQSPRQIEAFVEDLVGPARAAIFWAEFRNRFIAKADIAKIAAEGMNHVRLPINSRGVVDENGALLPEGVALIDRLLGWCREYGLWVVFDLHGAPGGQTGTNIDDSPNGVPELFTDAAYREQTIALWQALALRYRDDTVVAGYDLLNEPLPNEYQHMYSAELVALYRDLTAAIREVDRDHLLIYEGTHWATNWSVFDEVWDANSMLSFHKYWTPPDRPSIQAFLDIQCKLELPIYMGEGGENAVGWLHTAFQLYEDSGISWNFWPWKKMETHSSPCSVSAPAGWQDVLAYSNGGPRLQADDAWETLLALLDAVELDRCTYRPEVISAILRRAPLRIPAASFGFLGPGMSYGTSAASPLAGFRADDLVTIRSREGEILNFDYVDGTTPDAIGGLLVGLSAGDWIAYDVNVARPTALGFVVALDASAWDGTPIALSIDGEPIRVDADGGGVRGVTDRRLDAGDHVLRVECVAMDATIRSLEVTCVETGR